MRVGRLTDDALRLRLRHAAHAEEGEESFVVRGGPGGARFEVTALSRPATLSSRLVAPVARRIQLRVTSLYLAGIRDAAG